MVSWNEFVVRTQNSHPATNSRRTERCVCGEKYVTGAIEAKEDCK